MLYNSILPPHFDYADTVWGTCNTSSRQKVQKLQNRAAKIITGRSWFDSSTEALRDLNWNNLSDRYHFHLATSIYKVMNDLAPNYLASRFNVKIRVTHSEDIKTFPSRCQKLILRKDLFHIVVQPCGTHSQMQLKVRAI